MATGRQAPFHLAGYFRQLGLMPEGRLALFASDVRDEETFTRMIEAVRNYVPHEGRFPGENAAAALARKVGAALSGAGRDVGLFDSDIAALQQVVHINPPPVPGELGSAGAAKAQEMRALVEDIMSHIAGRGNDPAATYTAEEADKIAKWLDLLRPRVNDAKSVAEQVAVAFRNFVLFDYKDKRNIDTFLSLGFSYPYWYTRNLAHFGTRLMRQPGAVAALLKLRAAVERANGDLPEWWKDQVRIDTPMGQMYVPILSMLDPLNGLLGDKFRDPDQSYGPLSALAAEAQQYGPGVAAWIQIAMAATAAARGNDDAALSWMNYLGQPTRALNALSVLGREAGIDAIPPGGLGVETWLYNDNGRFVGSKYDANRVAYALSELVGTQLPDGRMITREMAWDAAMHQSGDLYDYALQKSKEDTAGTVLASYFFGAGVKPRSISELQMAQYDLAAQQLLDRKPGSGHPGEMSVEAYRLAWQQLREDYPFADYIQMFRKDPIDREEAFAWSVINRMPPNNRDFFAAVGTDPRLFDKWYKGGLSGMTDTERTEFTNGIHALGALLAMPDDATAKEWQAALNARFAMNQNLAREFGDAGGRLDSIEGLQDSFFNLGTQEEKTQFLTDHPELEQYWRRRDQYVLNDPLLSRYYASMDMMERSVRAQQHDELDKHFPGIDATWSQYYSLKATNPDGAKQYWAEHPELEQYLNARDAYTLQIRDQLEGLEGSITSISPRLVTLRNDIDPNNLSARQQDVTKLIESSRSTMGHYELPEKLNSEELKAALNLELNSIPQGSYRNVVKQLRQMGDLDRTLTAFQEFRNTGTVAANDTELRALLAAMDAIRGSGGWTLADGATADVGRVIGNNAITLDGALPSGGGGGYSGGSSGHRSQGSSSHRRIRSTHYGGQSDVPQNDNQQTQLDAAVNELMASLKDKSPVYWSHLRNMASMSPQETEALLKSNPVFADYLRKLVAAGYPLGTLLQWFKSKLSAPAAVTSTRRQPSGARPKLIRYSSETY
jgi:hypothetical protein